MHLLSPILGGLRFTSFQALILAGAIASEMLAELLTSIKRPNAPDLIESALKVV